MTTPAELEAPVAADAPAPVPSVPGRWRAAGRWAAVAVSSITVYAAFLVARGAEPVTVFGSMLDSAFGGPTAVGDTLVRMTPFLLAAVAVAVPARAGMINIGAEGQLVMGSVGAAAVLFALGGSAGPLTLAAGAAGGILAGAVWAGIAAVLKVVFRVNEAISTLLLNYVAGFVVTWLVFGPWKDPASLGQAYTRRLVEAERLPVLWGNRVHVGVVVAVVVAVAVWLVLSRTAWGFRLRVVGGNPDAARRAGWPVGRLELAAIIVGGAVAGLGGMIEVTGVEARLRPDMMSGFGYIGFLASWLARHDPLRAIGSAFLLAAIAIGGNGLKLSSGLSAAAVNILMAVVLLAVLGWGKREQA